MSKTTETKFAMPKFGTESFAMPKFDFEALIGMQKANVETLVQAQAVMVEAAQAIAKLQTGLLEETFKSMQAFLKFDAKVKPEAYLADAKAAAEKVMAVAKEELDVGMKAQTEVAQLVTKRAAANMEGLKAFAAA